ncbi:MAG: hypothetical protein RLZZ164_950 [Actinomycetota bacterium]|jgi:hypothetical protein
MSNFITKKAKQTLTPVKQVKLKLVHIDFWSAVRNGFMVTIAAGLATIIGFTFLWVVLSTTGLFGSLNSLLNSVVGGSSGQGVDVAQTLSLPKMLAFAGTIAIVNIILGTLLAGISALLFNLIARLSGGIRVGFTNE